MGATQSKFWRIVKTITKRGLQLFCIAVLAACIYFYENILHIYKWNPVVTPLSAKLYGKADTVAQAQKEDIEFLRKLPTIDRSFSNEALAKFYKELDLLESKAGSMSEAEFALTIAKAVALADNGHTNVSQRNLLSKFNRLPVRFYWFEGALHIVRAHQSHQALLGKEVVKIGKFNVQEALAKANTHFGGPENWRRYLSTAILESPELLAASNIADSPQKTELTILNNEGSIETVELYALPVIKNPDFGGRFAWMVMSPIPFPGEHDDWKSIGENWSETPLRFNRPNTPHQYQILDEGKGLYIRIDLILNYNDHNIDDFWQKIAGLGNQKFNYILLDMRNSPGGDYTTSVNHVAQLPNKLTENGKIYVATSNATFSAAIVNTSVAKYHGGDKTIIIGERVGDRDQFWAEGGFPFRLPHSNYGVSFATGFHDWVNGCTGKHPYCYSMNADIENPIESLNPDIEMIYTFDDFKAGKNPILDYIRAKH